MKIMPNLCDTPADVRLSSAHPSKPAYEKWSIASWFVLVIALLITAAETLHMASSVTRSAERDFISRSDDIYTTLTDKMDDYVRVLQSGVAFFNASDTVTREQWRTFTQSHKVEQQLLGIQGIGFALRIPRAELPQHIQKIRSEGSPEYNIRPSGDREIYSSIIFLEPFSDRNLRAFGYDMFSETVRRKAMEQARDTDSAVLSSPVVLVQETDVDVQVGTLMYIPVYRKGMPIDSVEHRRSAIYGWVYSPYRMNDMIRGLLGPRNVEKAQQLHLKIFDGEHPSPKVLLYGCHPAEDESLVPNVRSTRQVPIDFNGHRWTLRFTQTGGGFFTAEYATAWLTLGGGTIIAVLLFVLIRILLGTRDKAQRIAEKLTVDLRESETKFRLLAENIQDVFWLSTPTLDRIIYVSPAFEKIWGLSCESLYQKPQLFAEIIHLEDQKRVIAALQEHAKEIWSVEYRIIRSDASMRWILDRGFPVYDDSGTLIAMCGVAMDITERKQAEAALCESEERFDLLAKQAGIFFWDVDIQGLYTYASPVAEKVLGYRPDEMIGRMHFFDLHPESGREAFKAEALAIFRRKGAFTDFVNAAQTKDGRAVWLATTGQPILNVDGSLRGYRGSDIDITERKRVQEERMKLDKLQSVGTLAGGIAHDFNNILQGVYGNITFAKEDMPRDHSSYAFLDESEKSITRAVRLTKQLLTFSNGGNPVKEFINLGTIVGEIARFGLAGSNVSLVYHPADDLWPVEADWGQVEQVVSNLVINARQAMSQGGCLTITLENADLPAEAVPLLKQGRYVRVIIRDEGIGIEPKVIGQIFDPFFSTKQISSGLGLTIVWSIIAKHNGHIDVASELGKGTTFTFCLPASASALPMIVFPSITECPLSHKSAKILVLDDEESVRGIITRMLTSCGYAIETTLDGQETITRYKQALASDAPFDLVILDLTVPGGLGGEEVVKELLVLDPNVRAIVSSGYANNTVMADPARYGFKDAVTKPYTVNILRKIVARVLA